jgi:Family of unknown function (DUF6065)
MSDAVMKAPNATTPLPFLAYRLDPHTPYAPPVPASRWRVWANATRARFANRCLPLLVANQSGWVICAPTRVDVVWLGGEALDQVKVTLGVLAPAAEPAAVSHFGHGILTWRIPFLFRTPPGYSLLVRGPANSPKDAIAPLEGVLEADWAMAPFTMNWQLTRPNIRVRFDAGEPICMLVPQRRGELEAFHPHLLDVRDAPELHRHYSIWRDSRGQFNENLKLGRGTDLWQKHYFRGVTPSGFRAAQHQTLLRLPSFRADTGPRDGPTDAPARVTTETYNVQHL